MLVVKADLEGLLDYSNLDVESNNLSSLVNVNGCTLVVGSDQGQGAWRSWIKIPTMSGAEIRKKIDKDASYKPKNSYIIAQVAHVVCKKKHLEILSATVSNNLSTAYKTLQVSSLVFFKEPKEKRVKSYYIPRRAYNVCIELENLPLIFMTRQQRDFR